MQPSSLFRMIVLVSLVFALVGVWCSTSKDLYAGPDLRGEVLGESVPGPEATAAGSPRGHACDENLIPNSDLSRDENRDGVPDLWVRGSSPSLIRDSRVGWGAVGEGEGTANALWITGGRDMAGEWAVPLSGVEPGRTYVLSFFLYREDFRNGWYPEVEVFGNRHYLNHHTSFRDWQRVELLVTAPEDIDAPGWFRFQNRYPARFWLASPSLRPYRLSRVWAGHTRTGVELRWEETDSNLALEMELSVTDALGDTTRLSFLNLQAQEAWARLQGEQGGQGEHENVGPGAPDKGDCFRRGLAWAPLKGSPPFGVELKSLFNGKVIGEAGATLDRASSRDDRRDLPPETPPRLLSAPALPDDFFPIGMYNVPAGGLNKMAEAGFNTAHVCLPLTGGAGAGPAGGKGGSPEEEAAATLYREFKEKAARVPLRYMLSALEGRQPYSQEQLEALAARAREFGIRGDRLLSLYVADEPELSGISPRQLYGVQGALREVFPGVPSAVAMIRAWQLPYYRFSFDWFLVDPYPVPSQPLTWMSDTLEAAGDLVGQGRVMAVVQAFGGEETARDGWDRYPTVEEMRVLAFLAVVHGARGLFFYNHAAAAASDEQWDTVKRVVRDLNKVYPWIVRPASHRLLEPWVLTPEGWKREPARVHSAFFHGAGEGKAGGSGVLMVVNPASLPAEVRFEGLWGDRDEVVREILSGRPLVLKNGVLIDSLPPRGVHVYADIAP